MILADVAGTLHGMTPEAGMPILSEFIICQLKKLNESKRKELLDSIRNSSSIHNLRGHYTMDKNILPHSDEAENYYLGAVTYDNTILDRCPIPNEYFFNVTTRKIHSTMCEE